jgi:HD-GYP domain-containing protein (c-di-GMP phosphodiesterase class II)
MVVPFQPSQFHESLLRIRIRQHSTKHRPQLANFLTVRSIHHHERWDGSGYPAGISGEQIPLAARIVSIADVYDALSVRRVYKAPFPHEECVRIIREKSGKQFDPELVEVFLTIESQFRDIARRFTETSNEAQASQNADGQEQKQQLTPAQEEALISALTMDEPASRCTELVATTI